MYVGSDPRHDTSDWIQEIYQTGSKKCIRLDPKSVSGHQCVSGSEPCVGISLRDITLMSCPAGSCKCQSMSWNVTNVTTCHDLSRHVMTCHMSRDVFLDEGLCCHSSWYLLSLTLVIGFVTVDELASRLYINMNRYHSVHHHRWELRVFLNYLNTESRFSVLSVHLLLSYSVKISSPRSVSWNDAYPPRPRLSRFILFLICWVLNNSMSDNL